MSYYGSGTGEPPRRRLTPVQVATARRLAELRIRGAGALPVNNDHDMSLEFEQLPAAGAKGVVAESELTGDVWSAGKAQFFRAVPSGWTSVSFPVDKPGRYRLDLFGAFGPDFGNLRVWLDGRLVKREIRTWAPMVTPSGAMPIAELRLAPGSHTLRLEVSGKEPMSRGYNFAMDGMRLIPR
jgi:hypothetical protein